MQLDSLTVALRQRNNWEAIDLGVAMVRAHWKRLMLGWLTLFVPVTLLISAVLYAHPFLASLVVWWLKPMFDRVPLFMLSRAAFGEMPGIGETMKSLLPVWRRNLLMDLTVRRLNMARSFDMPVRDLEGLRGKAARKRLKDLHPRTRGSGVWLTLACVNFELVVSFSLVALIFWLMPQHANLLTPADLFRPDRSGWLEALLNATYFLSVSLIEPFYVAAGFALYLNRRTGLEGWDIEIVFRRMAQRIRSRMPRDGQLAAFLMAGCLVAGLCCVPHPAAAGGEEEGAPAAQAHAVRDDARFSVETQRRMIDEVLAGKDFRNVHLEKRWKRIGQQDTQTKAEVPGWLKWLAGWSEKSAQIAEAVLWLLLVLAIVWLIRKRKFWLGADIRVPVRQPEQKRLFGLDIAPESLPEDIAGEAWRLWQSGQSRAAMSLLYRGALSRIVAEENIELGLQATEEDCLRACRRRLPPEKGDYFGRITRAWQQIAYAARPVAQDAMQTLCRDWPQHFRKAS